MKLILLCSWLIGMLIVGGGVLIVDGGVLGDIGVIVFDWLRNRFLLVLL